MSAHSPSAIEAPALPRVPPPAAGEHPLRDVIVIVLFAMGIALPLIGAIAQRGATSVAFEKRSATAWPDLSGITARAEFTRNLEGAFDNRFGGRNALIRMHHLALAIGLHVSPVPKVLLGRDGWLFFRGEDAHAIERDFRGTFWYPPEQPPRSRASSSAVARFSRRGVSRISC